MKQHRKCDTAKYRRRAKKQRENTAPARKEAAQHRAFEEAKRAGQPKCPLCGYPLSMEDHLFNIKRVFLNRTTVYVHKICPTEVNK